MRIRPSRGWAAVNLRDLWHYRELAFFLTWRDIQVRYKQTIFGVAWVVAQPLLSTLLFTAIFGNFARLPSDGLPYAVFALAALVPWNFFATAVSRGALSLVGSAHLISKVYFPRLLVPIASILSGGVDMAISLVVLVGLAAWFGLWPAVPIFVLPFFLLLALGAAVGVSLWLSAFNVLYRDIGHLVPFLLQLWFYATPIVYPLSLIPERWRWLYYLNPMAAVVEGFRWAVLGKAAPPAALVAIACGLVAAAFVSGVFVFRRMERTFADVI